MCLGFPVCKMGLMELIVLTGQELTLTLLPPFCSIENYCAQRAEWDLGWGGGRDWWSSRAREAGEAANVVGATLSPEAHDALHHFSCKMLTPRHCTGNCSFKPPLLP